MSLISVAELRTHVDTDLVDAAVQRLLDDVDSEIIGRLGALITQTEVLQGGDKILFLIRRASSISTVTERIEEVNYALASNDYNLLGNGHMLERLTQGTNPFPSWRGFVTVVYVPVDETASRKRLEIDLVKLAIRYEALKGGEVGDVRTQGLDDYQLEREKLFRALSTSRRLLV